MSAPVSDRLSAKFAALKAENRGGLVVYVMAGDPDQATAQRIVNGLPAAGADIIELGMPFSDPMADGPAIQLAAQRALKGGASLNSTLATLKAFRETDATTPVVLMGYYNPIYAKGPARFAAEAKAAGADGVIVVDLPPEEAPELTVHLKEHGLHLIFLATPTTDKKRLPAVIEQASGFLYYVSITGITGAGSASENTVADALADLRKSTDLPIAVGFGIKTPEQAAAMAAIGDAAVVGSAVVSRITAHIGSDGTAGPGVVEDVLSFVGSFGQAVKEPAGHAVKETVR